MGAVRFEKTDLRYPLISTYQNSPPHSKNLLYKPSGPGFAPTHLIRPEAARRAGERVLLSLRMGCSQEDFAKRSANPAFPKSIAARKLYRTDRPHADIKDRIVIIVDDGIATGATTRRAISNPRTEPEQARGVPVAATSTIENSMGWRTRSLVQPEASSHSLCRTLSGELASDKLY